MKLPKSPFFAESSITPWGVHLFTNPRITYWIQRGRDCAECQETYISSLIKADIARGHRRVLTLEQAKEVLGPVWPEAERLLKEAV